MLLVENSLQVEAVDGAIAGSAIAAPTDALSGNDNGDALAVCHATEVLRNHSWKHGPLK